MHGCLVLTIFLVMSWETVLRSSQTFLWTSSMPGWAKLLSQYASKPPPSSWCWRSHLPHASTTTARLLVMHHIKSTLPPALDSNQIAYRSNDATNDATSTALCSTLTHMEKKDLHIRMLFIDFSEAFNTIIPQQLILKLVWLDFLMGRAQVVQDQHHHAKHRGSLRCVLSPYIQFIYMCVCVCVHR